MSFHWNPELFPKGAEHVKTNVRVTRRKTGRENKRRERAANSELPFIDFLYVQKGED